MNFLKMKNIKKYFLKIQQRQKKLLSAVSEYKAALPRAFSQFKCRFFTSEWNAPAEMALSINEFSTTFSVQL